MTLHNDAISGAVLNIANEQKSQEGEVMREVAEWSAWRGPRSDHLREWEWADSNINYMYM
jgi:hypothetical protein